MLSSNVECETTLDQGLRFKFSLETDETILSTSSGQVTSAAMYKGSSKLNEPVAGGQFCEVIFGSLNSYRCKCGQLNAKEYEGTTCEKCHVTITSSEVRNNRYGHIDLGLHYPSYWYLPTLSTLLGLSEKVINEVIMLNRSLDLVPYNYKLSKKELSKKEKVIFSSHVWIRENGDLVKYKFMSKEVAGHIADYSHAEIVGMSLGVENLYTLACELDSNAILELRYNEGDLLTNSKKLKKRKKGYQQMKLMETLMNNGFSIKDYFVSALLITPAGLNPIKITASNTINAPKAKLYSPLILNVNRVVGNQANAAEFSKIASSDEYKVALLMESNRTWFFQNRLYKTGAKSARGIKYPSLTETLKGKNGLFRGNLLGKRVDYSGRSVISASPDLALNEVGIPFGMCYELYKPDLIGKFMRQMGCSKAIATAVHEKVELPTLDEVHPIMLTLLRELVKSGLPVLLNRAPSLHRLSVLQLQIVMHYGKSILLPNGLCSAFNADFDGDQMSVHRLISELSKIESELKCSVEANLINAKDGSPVFTPSHESVTGLYYMADLGDNNLGGYSKEHCLGDLLSLPKPNYSLSKYLINNPNQIEGWLESYGVDSELRINQKVWFKSVLAGAVTWVLTTIGRLVIEQVCGIPPLTIRFNMDKGGGKKVCGIIIEDKLMTKEKRELALAYTQRLMTLGYKYGTKYGLSLCVGDLIPPSTKAEKIKSTKRLEIALKKDAQLFNKTLNSWTDFGLDAKARLWGNIEGELVEDWLTESDAANPLRYMYNTKARVANTQVKKMGILTGQIANSKGLSHSIQDSLRDGLNPVDYFASCSGARISLFSNQDVVPTSGYLYRQLMNAMGDIYVTSLYSENPISDLELLEVSGQYILDCGGRYDRDYKLLCAKNNNVDPDKKYLIQSPVSGRGKITSFQCGIDVSSRKLTLPFSPIGAIAAGSFCEPTTQLGLHAKHLSGTVEISENSNQVIIRETCEITNVINHIGIIEFQTNKGNYLIHKAETVGNFRELKGGDILESGDVLATYQENLFSKNISGTLLQLMKLVGASAPSKTILTETAIIAPFEGWIKYDIRTKLDTNGAPLNYVAVSIIPKSAEPSAPKSFIEAMDQILNEKFNGKPLFLGNIENNQAIILPEGTEVETAYYVTKGLPDVKAFHSVDNNNEAFTLFYNALANLYVQSGIRINPIHFEVLYRGLTDLHLTETMEVKVRSMTDEDLEPNFYENLSKIPFSFPSWLKSLMFGDTVKRLKQAANNFEVSQGFPTEYMIAGLKIISGKNLAYQAKIRKSIDDKIVTGSPDFSTFER